MDLSAIPFLSDLVTKLAENPKIMAGLVVLVVFHTAMKAAVDSINAARNDWDKTPDKSETWYEKALDIVTRVLKASGSFVAYLAGFRKK